MRFGSRNLLFDGAQVETGSIPLAATGSLVASEMSAIWNSLSLAYQTLTPQWNTLSSILSEETFSSAAGSGNALSIGNIPAGQHKAIWLKRIVNAAAAAYNSDSVIIRVEGDTAA